MEIFAVIVIVLLVGLIWFGVGAAASGAFVGARNKATVAASQHLPALVRRRAQLLTTDAYGNIETRKWFKEIDHFLRTQVLSTLSESETRQATARWNEMVLHIENYVAEEVARNPASYFLPVESMSPVEFEKYCAELLQKGGWNARVTQAGADQGVDVVAEIEGARLVLQCKLHSRPIGNKAVQEAVAGRSHFAARWAAVVSNQSYTTSAEQLARTNGVLLLHHSQLATLAAALDVQASTRDPMEGSIDPDLRVPEAQPGPIKLEQRFSEESAEPPEVKSARAGMVDPDILERLLKNKARPPR